MSSKLYESEEVEIAFQGNINEEHFAEGFNFYKFFWIFVIGSVIGFVLETLWNLVIHGNLASRTSLIFLPFTVIYGIGAIVLYGGLHNINKQNYFHIFIFGFVAGTAIELIASYAQEKIFGSVSWNYSNVPLNINGRVCLSMSLIWGVLAIAWIKWLQPLLEMSISKIPISFGKRFTYILLIILIISIIMSVLAVARWSDRINGVASINFISQLLDSAFPNSLMEIVYPNMVFF